MFDEFDKNVAPASGPSSVGPMIVKTEDIFSEVDKVVKPDVLKPRDNNSSPDRGTVIPKETGWLKNKMMVLGLIFGGLIIVIGGGFIGLRLMVKSTAPVNTEIKEEVTPTIEIPVEPEITAPVTEEINNVINQPVQPVVTQPADSDQDGLTDEEELQLGTNANDSDTDQDGLTDREETKVYGTDPLYFDTDGDGYKDGEEVKNGFNPKGAGKLLDINSQQ